jgi:hypothetical protein
MREKVNHASGFTFLTSWLKNHIFMKKTATFLLALILTSTMAFSQSDSYQILKDNFTGRPDVHSFSVNGFFCRMILGMTDEWEFKEAIKEVQHVRIITIPTEEFEARGLSVNGYKKLLKKDSFEELASVRDNGDHITFYLQATGNKNRYMIVVQEPDEVVVIEMKGDIDVNLLMEKNNTLSLQNR